MFEPDIYNNTYGKHAYAVTTDKNLTIDCGKAVSTGDVSGVTFYSAGFDYGGKFYASEGDKVAVKLNKETPVSYTTTINASAGSYENGVLTMPAYNVLITASTKINRYNVTLPEDIEIINGAELTDGKADYGTEIKFKPAGNYVANYVKLNWTTVEGAEKYAVCGYIGGKWQILAQGITTSYILNDLTAGKNYKVAVITKLNGKWVYDVSNAITVTPKAEAAPAPTYPVITSQVSGGSSS